MTEARAVTPDDVTRVVSTLDALEALRVRLDGAFRGTPYGMVFAAQMQQVEDTVYRILGVVYYQVQRQSSRLRFGRRGFQLRAGLDAELFRKTTLVGGEA